MLLGVAFTYPGSENPALRDIILRFLMGSTLGLVGSSGSGKTTLVDLLLALLVLSDGTIILDADST